MKSDRHEQRLQESQDLRKKAARNAKILITRGKPPETPEDLAPWPTTRPKDIQRRLMGQGYNEFTYLEKMFGDEIYYRRALEKAAHNKMVRNLAVSAKFSKQQKLHQCRTLQSSWGTSIRKCIGTTTERRHRTFSGIFTTIIIIIDSMTSVFNTDASLPYNLVLLENLIVKKRIKMDGEGTYCCLTTIIPRCLRLQTLIQAIWIETDNEIATDIGFDSVRKGGNVNQDKILHFLDEEPCNFSLFQKRYSTSGDTKDIGTKTQGFCFQEKAYYPCANEQTGDVEPWTVNVERPTASEVYDCICPLKRHRASGPDDLPPALFKDGAEMNATLNRSKENRKTAVRCGTYLDRHADLFHKLDPGFRHTKTDS
ncbi:hypothetical protein CLF_102917 [Clonorchis sinensis]|uniref:Uncharacterized protein n=1 Tax=Clonorchis sinensis TaxID=79923 RepID=G7Y8S0_CLOSI|nr:hypothetical protein CLF_102917 [Clonorchis sinensis]